MKKQIKLWRTRLITLSNFGRPGFLRITVLLAVLFKLPSSSRAQDYAYQFTAPINGWFQQGAADPIGGASLRPWGGIGNIFDFGILSETAYYNPISNTLQQIGYFTLDSTSFSGSFEDDKEVDGSLVPGTISVSYTLNNGNNIVSFDSGVESIGANPTLNWSIPFSETITLATGGQDYVDTMSGTIPEANDITCISQFSPNSIVISQGWENHTMNIGSQYYANFDASDGWSGSIYDGIGDGTLPYYYSLAPVTALAVPEPACLMIFTIGALGLKILARRER